METLKYFLESRIKSSEQVEVYVELVSKLNLANIASKIGSTLDVEFTRRQRETECEAFISLIGDNEITILQAPEDVDAGYFQIVIEPGPESLADGEYVDLTNEFIALISSSVPDIGDFKEIE